MMRLDAIQGCDMIQKTLMVGAMLIAFAMPSAANERRDLLVSYKQQLTDRCLARVAHRRSAAEAMPRCTCLTEATAKHMTLAEIMELEQIIDTGVDTRHLPQVRRITPQLELCRQF